MKLILVKDQDGLGIYLTTTRLIGPKPWTGKDIIKQWEVSADEIQKLIDEELACDISSILAKRLRQIPSSKPEKPYEDQRT